MPKNKNKKKTKKNKNVTISLKNLICWFGDHAAWSLGFQ